MSKIIELTDGRKIELIDAKIFSKDEYFLYKNTIPSEVKGALSTTNYTNVTIYDFRNYQTEGSFSHNIYPVITFNSNDAFLVGERFKIKDYKFCMIAENMAICLEYYRMKITVADKTVFSKTLVPFYVEKWFESLLDNNFTALSASTFHKKIESGEIVPPKLQDVREFKQTDTTYIEIDEYGVLSKYIPAINEDIVIVPDSVCAIRNEAFSLDNERKAQFKKIVFPQTLSCIEKGTFKGVTKLETFEIHPNNLAFALKDGALYSCKLIKSRVGGYKFPDKDKHLDVLLMYPPAKKDITELNINMNDIEIAKSAFEGCQLKKITIDAGDAITEFRPFVKIEDKTFANCKNLIELKIIGSNTVRFFGRNIFNNCNPNIIVKFDNVETEMITEGLISRDKKSIWYGQSYDDSWIVPDGVKKFGSTIQHPFIKGTSDMLGIGMVATTRNIATFKKIVLPDSFVSVTQQTFSCSNMLEEIVFGKKTKDIRQFTLSDCPNLHTVIAPGVNEIGLHAFFLSPNIKRIALGPNCAITNGSFHKCDEIVVEAPKDSITINECKNWRINYIEI